MSEKIIKTTEAVSEYYEAIAPQYLPSNASDFAKAVVHTAVGETDVYIKDPIRGWEKMA